ncbi:CofD-related protein, GAK system [Desulfonatronum thiosulfatophilum]|uniref:CofD-related protein, GAK system n=1 Tax=Desulfonatronum thiosulfatophilum TaxID=617002 RepID=A0A1G6BPP6_9BACT|nr:GAK system CofD-like protein [Desulfonatronum thiosulfatophilum]SDB22569.1 CofD-related protein, GAK system [Desulfonatronum thiosulfatophilum]
MKNIRITRTADVPDELRLARSLKAPEFGPRILFFSGGTALNPLSRDLVQFTHNSIHLVTPFDSGGSSAKLRKVFRMPAVGDLRSRLMALTDQSVKGNPEVRKLFAHRLSLFEDPELLRQHLQSLASGEHLLMQRIPDPMGSMVRDHLGIFLEHMPQNFDLRGASIGNLILAAGYLAGQRNIDTIIFLFSKLAEVLGEVLPVLDEDLHLAAELENGTHIIGQHLLTGKEVPPISSRIKRIWINRNPTSIEPARARIRNHVRDLIVQADLICFPMGSFYSSVIANVLPDGVGQAVSENDCPKVYIPNTGADPEQFGMTLADNVTTLLRYLRKSSVGEPPVNKLINVVLLDSHLDRYAQPVDVAAVQKLGIEVLAMPLVDDEQEIKLEAKRLLKVLLSLI